MVYASDKISLAGSARNGWLQRRLEDHCGLFKGVLLTKVAQELQEPNIPRQVGFAHTTKHAQIRLEQGEQALRAVLVDVTPRVFFLGMIDERVHIALQCPVAAGRVRVEPTARSHRDLGCLLHRLHREILGRLDDDCPLTTDPGDDRGPVFVVVTPPGLTFLATPSRSVPQTTSCRPAWLVPCYRRCDRGHPLPPCLPVGGASHRTRPHGAATSTPDSWY